MNFKDRRRESYQPTSRFNFVPGQAYVFDYGGAFRAPIIAKDAEEKPMSHGSVTEMTMPDGTVRYLGDVYASSPITGERQTVARGAASLTADWMHHAERREIPPDVPLHTAQVVGNDTVTLPHWANREQLAGAFDQMRQRDPEGLEADPWLIKLGEDYHIADGHHRIAIARDRGEPVTARVWDPDAVGHMPGEGPPERYKHLRRVPGVTPDWPPDEDDWRY